MTPYPNQLRRNANYKRGKLVVIDDNEDHWFLIQRAAQACLPGVELVWISSAQQAIIQLEAWQHQEWEVPKLILQDLYLPTPDDGWELLRRIKNMPPPVKYSPIVMLSSSVNRLDIRTAYELGVSSYVAKPLDFEQWLNYFQQLGQYWWETVTLPPVKYTL